MTTEQTQHDAKEIAAARWPFVLRVAITVALVLYLADQVEWTAMAQSLSRVHWGVWLAAWGVYLLSQFVSSRRWSGLARAVGLQASDSRFLRLYFEGMFFSLCLPTSIGGDVVKAYRLAPTLAARVLAGCTVLADRLCGLTALVAIGVVALVAQSLKQGVVSTVAVGVLVAAAMVGGVRAGLALARAHAERLERMQKVGRIVRQLRPYYDQPVVIARALAWSLAVQALNVACVWCVGRALGVDVPLAAYCVAVPTVSLLTALPLSINGVGIREGGLALLLAGYGLTHEEGIALGLLWFLVVMASGLAGGAVYLFGRPENATGQHTQKEQASGGLSPPLAIVEEPTHSASATELLRLEVHAAHAARQVAAPHRMAPAAPARLHLPQRTETMDLSIVIPVYNERENIRRLYDAVKTVLVQMPQSHEIVLVDDGSKDGSTEQLKALAEHDRTVKVVCLRRNFGQTAAMHAGIQMATGDVIVTMDADLQNDPTDIPMMLAKLDEGYDLVHGWRKNRQDGLVLRKIPSKAANWLISKVTRFPVHDLGCTLKAVRREIAQEIPLYGEMHRFIPILASWRGARCVEVVTKHHPRRFGVSKYGISRTLRVVLDLITVKYMISYLTSPMRLFGGFGLGCTALGMACGFATAAMKAWAGHDMTGNPLLLLTALLIMVGLQFFVLGMLGEVCVRTYYESQGSKPYAIRELVNFEPREAPAPFSTKRAA